MRVTQGESCFARQKMEIPVRVGARNSGNLSIFGCQCEVEYEIWADETHTSQTKMAMKTSQKNLRRFFCDRTVLSRCRASKRLTWGIRLGKTCATHQYRARVDACRRQPGATYNVRGIDGERSHESSDAVSEAL